MPQETTLNEVLEAVQTLAGHVDEQFAEVRADLSGVKQDLSGVKQDLSGVKQDLSGVKQDLSGVKQDLSGVKQDLADTKNELLTEIDRFVVLHQTLDVELASLRSRCERMELFMVRVGKKLDMEYEPT